MIKSKLIGTKEFYLRVVNIVLPMIIQNTITNIVSFVDNIMVGRIGTLEMSAVAIVNQLMFVVYLCIFGGLAGAGIFATQYAGAKDNEGMRYCFRAKTILAFLMTVIAICVFLCFKNPLINMYLAENTSIEDAKATHGLIGSFIWLVCTFIIVKFFCLDCEGYPKRDSYIFIGILISSLISLLYYVVVYLFFW